MVLWDTAFHLVVGLQADAEEIFGLLSKHYSTRMAEIMDDPDPGHRCVI